MTLLIAMILDAIFGEPKSVWDKYPHPAVLMGRVIDWADRRFNTGSHKRLKGVALVATFVVSGWLIGTFLTALPDFGVLEILIAAILLAHRSLVDHVRAVADALSIGIEKGRKSVSHIVGRETAQLDQSGVARAAIESAAENFSDGVIAPAFWFLILGLPGIIIYKLVNTADSMIGYLTDTHREFGWAAARLDDLLNWVPARLTGALLCLASGNRDSWEIMRDDAQYHRSPNAGWPEAAMAGALDIALSGPRIYHGTMTSDPYVHVAGTRDLDPSHISAAITLLWKGWAVFLFSMALISMILAVL